MSAGLWVLLILIGILVNVVMLMKAAADEPNGAMGMGLALLFAGIPFLFPVLWLAMKIKEAFDGSK